MLVVRLDPGVGDLGQGWGHCGPEGCQAGLVVEPWVGEGLEWYAELVYTIHACVIHTC